MLLTEYTNAQAECLHESEAPRWRFKNVVLMKADSLGKNGRVYPADVMAKAVAKYVKEKVEPGLAFGCLQHDAGAELNPEHISHRIVSLRMIGQDVVGDVEVLESEMGRTLAAMLESNGGVMGFSSRSLGAVDQKGIVQPGLQIQAIDAVLSPANTGGTLAHAILEDEAGVPITAADPQAMAGLGKRDVPVGRKAYVRRIMDTMKKHFRSERLAKGSHVNTQPTIDQVDGRGETPAAQSLQKRKPPITMKSAPPGMEHMVKVLKRKFPGDEARAFKIAWSHYDKKHDKEESVDEDSDYGRPASAPGDSGGAQWRKPKNLKPDRGTAGQVKKQSVSPTFSRPDRGNLRINEQALHILKQCPADHPLREAAGQILAHWGSGMVPSKPMHAAASYFKKSGSGHKADGLLRKAFGAVHGAIKQAHAEGMGAHHLDQAMQAHAAGNTELAKAHETIAAHHIGASAVKLAKARAVVGEDHVGGAPFVEPGRSNLGIKEARFSHARAKAAQITAALKGDGGSGQVPHHFVGREPDEVREFNHRMGRKGKP